MNRKKLIELLEEGEFHTPIKKIKFELEDNKTDPTINVIHA